jgi:alpha-tubulin suppressor-like RCC1 family protein
MAGNNTVYPWKYNYPVSVSFAESVAVICAGMYFNALIRGSDGMVFVWGSGGWGVFGNNTTGTVSYPVSISSGDSFTQICGGDSQILARRGDGRLFAWGYNAEGELGDNSTTDKSVPVSVSTGDSFKEIAFGEYFGLAIRGSDGRLFAWGYNLYGQLGDNTTVDKSVPVSVSTGDSFVQIACGYNHSMAIRGDGRLFAWGLNDYGQLGDNAATTNKSIPVSVSTGDSFIKVACTRHHSMAIRGSDNVVFCWGRNGDGQLGQWDYTHQSVPVSIYIQNPYINAGITRSFIEIAAGDGNSYAINLNSKAFAWGGNTYGQLGQYYDEVGTPVMIQILPR